MESSGSERFLSLQAARGVAALLVLFFHLGGAIAAPKYFDIPAFSVPMRFGDSGVIFFFVLSGFIILTAHRKDLFQPSRIPEYIRRRLLRIYPAYWIVFLTVAAFALSSASLRDSVPHDPVTILKALSLIPQDPRVVGGTGAQVIIVAWTLQYEMLFYAAFALLLLRPWQLALVALAAGAWSFTQSEGASPLLPFLQRSYFALFGLGLATAFVCSRWTPSRGGAVLLTGLGTVLYAVTATDVVLETNLLGRIQIAAYGLAGTLLIWGLVGLERHGIALGRHRFLQLLGDASYALYLIHFPLISLLCKVAMRIGLKSWGVVGATVSYAGIAAACVIVAIGFHLGIERPLARWLRGRSCRAIA